VTQNFHSDYSEIAYSELSESKRDDITRSSLKSIVWSDLARRLTVITMRVPRGYANDSNHLARVVALDGSCRDLATSLPAAPAHLVGDDRVFYC
jgi:hypothetical protein